MTKMAKSTTERVSALRAKMRAAGFKLLHLWAHPEDEARIKAYIKRLIAKRGGRP
jgi:hypothetical protein